jgi:hypothetical protein
VQLHEDGEWVLNVDCRHIHAFDRALYSHLLNYPAEVTSLLDNEARYVLAQLFPDQDPAGFEHFVVSHPVDYTAL